MHRLTPYLAATALLASGGAVAAGDPHAHDDGHDHPAEGEHGIVRLHPDELAEFGIELAAAGPDTIETWVELPGEVHPDEDRLAHIVPRYSGIATDARAHIGDAVAKGEVLAVVESDESLAPFEVRTLIAGTVIAKHISLGEAVSRDRDVYVIADLSSVWVDLTVYQRDLDRIRVGQSVRLLVGHEPAPDAARISYVTPVVDASTRTATARVVLPNPAGTWRPGMFVTGRVLLDDAAVDVAVPRSALHTVNGRTVVFVEDDGGLRPRPVRVGREGRERVEVRDGLAPGERYVRAGGFTLKAELAKEFFGDGHGH